VRQISHDNVFTTVSLSGNWTFRPFVTSPLDVSPPRRFVPERIQHFLPIQLKPKRHRLEFLTDRVTVCVLN